MFQKYLLENSLYKKKFVERNNSDFNLVKAFN